MSVNHSVKSGGIIGIFSIFFNMNVLCVLIRIATLNYPKSTAMGFFSRVETAVVNEPSVFGPRKFYCIFIPTTLYQTTDISK